MSWRTRLADWIGGPARAGTTPVETLPTYLAQFGPGIGNQPSHEVLLRESLGVADFATRALANRVSMLELLVKQERRVEDGTTQMETIDDHPLKQRLDNPHPDMTWSQIARVLTQYIVTVGEAYLLKIGNRLQEPARLDVIPPQHIWPVVRQNEVVEYRIRDANGVVVPKPADTVVRMFYPDPENPWGSEGYLGPNGIATDTMRYQSEHLRTFFQKNAVPPAVFEATPETPQPLPETLERFADEWRQNVNQRLGRDAGTPRFIPPGFKLVQMALQSGADITPLLEYFTDEQLMNFGVPKAILGKVVSGDRSSAETMQYVVDLHHVTPITNLISEALTRQLAPDFGENLAVEYAEFVARDKAHDLARERQDLELKIRSVNQVREEDRGEDPVIWGDLPVGTMAETPYDGSQPEPFVPEEEGAIEPPPEGEEGADTEAMNEEEEERQRQEAPLVELFGPFFARTLRGILEQQRRETLRRLREAQPRQARIQLQELFDVEFWRSLFQERVDPIYRVVFARTGQGAMAQVGAGQTPFIFNSEVTRRIQEEGAKLVTRTGTTTRKRLANALAQGLDQGESIDQLARRVNEVFGSRKRDARTIARTEVGKASQAAQLEGYRQTGFVQRKRWNTSRDAAVRPCHRDLEGVVIPLAHDFDVCGFPAAAPLDPRLPASQSINCRCFVTPVLDA